MARVDRPTKSGGNRQYQQEVAAGFIDILDAEVDGDLDTVYGLVNGNLDNYNISATAAIAYSKLSLTGQITNSDIAGTAKISTSKIDFAGTGANTVPGSTIQDGSLIGNTKIFPGTGIQANVLVTIPSYIFSATGPERYLTEISWTSRKAHWLAVGYVIGVVGFSNAVVNTLSVSLRLDGTPGGLDGAVITTVGTSTRVGNISGTVSVPVTLPFLARTSGTNIIGTRRIAVSATLGGTSINGLAEVTGGQIYVVEFD